MKILKQRKHQGANLIKEYQKNIIHQKKVLIQENVNYDSKKDGPILIFSGSMLKGIKELKLSDSVYIKKECISGA